MGIAPLYNEFIEFLAGGFTSQEIINYKPSSSLKSRVLRLVAKEKEQGLSDDEKSQLEHFMRLEHIIRLAKAKARKHINE